MKSPLRKCCSSSLYGSPYSPGSPPFLRPATVSFPSKDGAHWNIPCKSRDFLFSCVDLFTLRRCLCLFSGPILLFQSGARGLIARDHAARRAETVFAIFSPPFLPIRPRSSPFHFSLFSCSFKCCDNFLRRTKFLQVYL